MNKTVGTILNFGIFFALFAILFLIVRQCDRQPDVKVSLLDLRPDYDKQIKEKDSIIFRLQLQHFMDSVEDRETDSIYRHNVAMLKRKITPTRVIQVTDTTATRAQLALRDSMISLQDTAIAGLYGRLAAQRFNTQQLTDAYEQKIQVTEDYVHDLEETVVKQNGQFQRAQKIWRRQRTWERIAEGLLIVGVIIVAI